MPTGSAVTVHRPTWLVSTMRVWPVLLFLMVTETPGRTAPVVSCTVPLRLPLGLACANARLGRIKSQDMQDQRVTVFMIMGVRSYE